MTAEQVRAARAEGYAAGYALTPSRPNPYAPRHLPIWHDRRTATEKANAEKAEQPARILAGVWLRAHSEGLAAHARERELTLPSVG
ncbi:hypothetical protein [Saccharothrix violaceirubra]|uniref:Uncharacterized protein n=1 Tax=Saccharothrix violaceirubra TaxID=413306 RepID=A0A7W7WZ42_9PSEU|nr:hypothetical protein [Saccharothrix violaceirubra]MBB4969095.1 hypothetical protein [Saccharothrix violaceirubra]